MNALQNFYSGTQDSKMDPRDAHVAGQVKALQPSEAQAEIAAYIAQMSGEMASLASAAKFELLAYFLDMARVESELLAQRGVAARP